jgi:transcription initiation factor TFIIIB Brf1 subunit/transcription initiation factor TFIIB
MYFPNQAMSRRRNSFADEEEEDHVAAVDGMAGTPRTAGSAPADSTRTNDNNHDDENDDGNNAKEPPNDSTMEETVSGMSRKLSLSDSRPSKKQATDSSKLAATAATSITSNGSSLPHVCCSNCGGSAIKQHEEWSGTCVCSDCAVVVEENMAVSAMNSKVENQAVRALQLWEERCHEGSLDQSRFAILIDDDGVKHDLKKGRVPPIFHAVVSKSKPLFSTSIHKLSSDPVRPGTAAKSETVPKLSSLSDPYNILFSDNQSVANSIVQDKGIPSPGEWEFDKAATRTVVKLVNSKATMMGADVESTDGLDSALFQDPSAETFSLLTRSQSRGVVANCFDSSKSGSSLAITGSPGIGKSWTLLYALQQALLYENAIVVFMLRKDVRAFLCVRRNHHVYVWRAETEKYVSLFGHKDVLVLFDPIEATEGGADFARGERMLIFAASNNKAHFDKGVSKVQKRTERYLGLWTEAELAAALRKFAPLLTLREALDRAKQVGMLPRYIMDEDFRDDRKRQLQRALLRLKHEPSVLEETLNFNGKSDTPEVSVAGTLFAVGPTLMANGGADGEDDEGESEDGLGEDGLGEDDLGEDDEMMDTGVAFDDSTDEESDGSEQPDVGYEGQFVKYTERVLSFMTALVPIEIANIGREHILAFWNKTCKEGGAVQMGFAVEDLFSGDLKSFIEPGTCQFTCWLQVKGRNNVGVERKLENTQKCSWSDKITIDGLSSIFNRNDTIGRMRKGSGLVDFVGPGRKVYQVTVGRQHKKSLRSLVAILVQAGFLLKTGGSLKLAPVSAPHEKLEFYWVVPSSIHDSWKKKNPYCPTLEASKKAGLNRRDKNVLQKCLEKYVKQYVLVLEMSRTSE